MKTFIKERVTQNYYYEKSHPEIYDNLIPLDIRLCHATLDEIFLSLKQDDFKFIEVNNKTELKSYIGKKGFENKYFKRCDRYWDDLDDDSMYIIANLKRGNFMLFMYCLQNYFHLENNEMIDPPCTCYVAKIPKDKEITKDMIASYIRILWIEQYEINTYRSMYPARMIIEKLFT